MPPLLSRLWRWVSRKNDKINLPVKEHPRYTFCRILYAAGIPCVLWGEDALLPYDIPTAVFDLFLLVHDPESAAQVLASHGLTRTAPNPRFSKIPPMSHHGIRFAELPAEGVHNLADLPESHDDTARSVVLLPAKYWGYKLPQTVDEMDSFIPPLPALLNILINVWMDIPESENWFLTYIGIHISYFYLYNSDIREPGFENKLAVENRQLHYELLQGSFGLSVAIISSKCQEHQRNIRNLIRLGQYEPGKAMSVL